MPSLFIRIFDAGAHHSLPATADRFQQVLHCRCPSLHARGYLRVPDGRREGLDVVTKAEHSELFRGIEGVGGRHYVLRIQELTHENIMLLIW